MELTKLKLINFIINEANENQLSGLEELIYFEDINYGLELILGENKFNEYLLSHEKIFKEDIEYVLKCLLDKDIDGATKILNEILKVVK